MHYKDLTLFSRDIDIKNAHSTALSLRDMFVDVQPIYTLHKTCKRRKSVIDLLLVCGIRNIKRNEQQSIDRSWSFL